jgi:hypothetical protein
LQLGKGRLSRPIDECLAAEGIEGQAAGIVRVLSGDFDGLHGWALLKNPATGEEFGPVAAKVAAFLTAHTHG